MFVLKPNKKTSILNKIRVKVVVVFLGGVHTMLLEKAKKAEVSWNLYIYIYIYYIDASVLLENNQWRIFHILISEDIDDLIHCFLHWIYAIKRKWHGGANIDFIFEW